MLSSTRSVEVINRRSPCQYQVVVGYFVAFSQLIYAWHIDAVTVAREGYVLLVRNMLARARDNFCV